MPTEIENVSLEGEGTAAGVELPRENVFIGAKNRILQILARFLPGEASLRIWLHRWRGVKIGEDIQIGTDVIIETAYPQWVVIGNRVVIAARTLIMAHAHGLPPKKIEKDYVSVEIKDDVYIGPGALILANIKIGQGSVVTAGSVVTRSVPPHTMVQGNPAKQIAKCGIPLLKDTPLRDFYRKLRPIDRSA